MHCHITYVLAMAKSQVQVQGKTHASHVTLVQNLHTCPESSGIAIISIGNPVSANILALKVSRSANLIDFSAETFFLP